MTDEETQETGPTQEEIDDAARWYYSEIMAQLLESDRFCKWFQVNFDVHKMINEDEKSIEVRVMEVHPALVQQRMEQQVAEEIKKQADAVGIVTASAADLQQLEGAAKKRRKKKR